MTTAADAATPPAALRPVVAVDVDGVLNPDDPADAASLGYQPHHYTGPGPDGQHTEGTVWLHPVHGTWLAELATAGAELVWCTSWRNLAATWIAARLGLPTNLAAIDITAAGVRWGHQAKLFDLYRAVGNRPVAVLDDAFGGKDPDHAHHRTRSGAPTLLVPVNPRTGLRRADIDAVRAWLHRLPGPADG
ncbi:HAD domain-containing protein [Dactylosporangium sp. NPDC050688]|uniref:HAD domain-containing protein n=1 Tax=Dactylosporangium sp. NPDC050688 TaxID=3157217 RepID=UPI0034030070